MLTLAKRLSDEISHIDGLEVVSTEYLKKNFPPVHERDETKIIVDVAKIGLNGYEVAISWKRNIRSSLSHII